ncbi:ABC1 kinase family protein [Geminicoccus roseus]|uniref:ABC1 kinase family protein n=1 Tax=Geminicoccus roseus TaxID=404900 RepID=UPI000406390B|nr:AarF/ABC1/UbiB kinase family protein [Geminicoccus roseus]
MPHQAVALRLVSADPPSLEDQESDFRRFSINEDYVPTPLRPLKDRRKVEIQPRSSKDSLRGLRVLVTIIGYFLRARLNRWFRKDFEEANAKALRAIFEHFGGLWVKLGQLLSLRTDMFSAAMCRELSRLQFEAVGFPVKDAVASIEAELGGPLMRFFSRFDMEPFAAASIAQVHRAVLRETHEVVIVKVRRPGIKQAFEGDLKALQRMVRIIGWLRLGPHMRWGDAVWELEQMMREELDYRYEAANLDRMRKSLKAHGVHVPRPYFHLSTDAVIVMEYVPGVLMSEYIEVASHDPERAEAWCAANGIRPKKVAQRLFISALRQLLEDNLFHADLHPGNIMLLRNNRVALIDMGTIGTMEREFLELYLMSLRSLAQKDFSRAADYLLRLCPDLPTLKLTSLRRDLIRSYRNWEARTHLRNVPYHEKALSSAGSDSGKILYKYKVQPTWTFMRVSRTWATLDASMQFLIPNANYMKLFDRYFQNARYRALRGQGLRRSLEKSVSRMVEAVHEYDLLLRPLLRNETLSLTGSVSKLASMGAVILRGLVYAFGFGLIFAMFAHFKNQHDISLDGLSRESNEILDFMEGITYGESIVYVCAIIWILIICRKLLKLAEQPDYRS